MSTGEGINASAAVSRPGFAGCFNFQVGWSHSSAAGFVDPENGCFMKPEVGVATTKVFAGVQS